jgi:SAM-dependent methyltransferase
MAESDRLRWDERYRQSSLMPLEERFPIDTFAAYQKLLPIRGFCLEIACGEGRAAVWLARRGMTVYGVDVSAVAIDRARRLAAEEGVADRCRFEVHDLDGGLPKGSPVDLLLCHNFRDPRLYCAMAERLAPSGILAIATLSEVGVEPGRFRAKPAELGQAFAQLERLGEGERAGQAWLIGRKASEEQA